MTKIPSSQDPLDSNNKKDNKKKIEGKIEDLYDYAKQNKRDTFAQVLLVLGLILMFFMPFYGGLLVGIVGGLYFSTAIVSAIQNRNQLIYEYGTTLSLVFVGLLVAFLIGAPGVFIGIAIVTAIKQFLLPEAK